ncbi:GNAT family N-acetyltransferase [Oceanobacillus timonensis]|uniref:GNAT family N-acetyltransferase n=1 Tax=Oceanobacillus timonensis TaxID=1926285 RepID=UPI0009BB9608|nr:GNAT family N-acetyltransferase [Oceanobacillus timonensis]
MQWKKPSSEDYTALIQLWEKSVLATHDFLKSKDREEMKAEIPTYFPQLDMKSWYHDDTLIGFSGVNERNLEMLFLDPDQIGKGFGSIIIKDLIEKDGIQFVDVNKDNTSATAFYLKHRFQVIGESEQDGQGRDYALLHLGLDGVTE